MSCRIFVSRTELGSWSVWLETKHKPASSTSVGLALSIAFGVVVRPNPLHDARACARGVVVGWLPQQSFAQHRAWADKFSESRDRGDGDSLDFVVRVLNDRYVEHYLDVVPTRETLEALLDDGDQDEAHRPPLDSNEMELLGLATRNCDEA